MPTLTAEDKIVLTIFTCLAVAFLSIILMVAFAVMGSVKHAPNSIVVAVIFAIIAVVSLIACFNSKTKLKQDCNQDLTAQILANALFKPQTVEITGCDDAKTITLNKLLLFVYPYDSYRNFGIDHLTEWVDPDKDKKSKKATKQD